MLSYNEVLTVLIDAGVTDIETQKKVLEDRDALFKLGFTDTDQDSIENTINALRKKQGRENAAR